MELAAQMPARLGEQSRQRETLAEREALVAHFERHLDAHARALRHIQAHLPQVATAAGLIVRAMVNGGTLYTCGNGGSAAEAEHLATELVGRFRHDRRALPACSLTSDSAALTAIANDYGYNDVFARQLEALGRPGDILVAISTSGESESVIRAAQSARQRRMMTVAMTGVVASSLSAAADITLHVPSHDTPTIQELHMCFTHLLCEAIERQLCPNGATA